MGYLSWLISCRLLWLNLGARGKHLTCQLSLIVAWLLATHVCSAYPVDELFLVLCTLYDWANGGTVDVFMDKGCCDSSHCYPSANMAAKTSLVFAAFAWEYDCENGEYDFSPMDSWFYSREWVWNLRTKLCCIASGKRNGSSVSLQKLDGCMRYPRPASGTV